MTGVPDPFRCRVVYLTTDAMASYAAAHRPVERAAVRGRMEAFVEGLERDPEGERQLLAREAGWVQARADDQAPPLRQLVAERERARAWEEERARVLEAIASVVR